MRRDLALGLVAAAGLVLGLGLMRQRGRSAESVETQSSPAMGASSSGEEAGGPAPAASPSSASRSSPGGEGPPGSPLGEAACDPCFEGTPLSWRRSPDQVAVVQAWDEATWQRAVAAVWQLHEAGQLDFAEARRDDQALLIDRRLGTDISPETRTALLDLHGESQAALEAARNAGEPAEAVGRALHLYRDGAAQLLTASQEEALFLR